MSLQDSKVTVMATEEREVSISRRELRHALFQVIQATLGQETDDAGCDWYTVGKRIYIAYPEWIVADNEAAARLVDAANVLLYGHPLHGEEQEAA